jgi:hypothetical protein
MQTRFSERFAKTKFGELQAICEADGLCLQAKSKEMALTEMYAHYTGTAPMKPLAQPAPEVSPEAAPAPASKDAPLEFEGRVSRLLASQGPNAHIIRLGIDFSHKWLPLSAEQVEALKLMPNNGHVEVRIKK